MKKKWIAGFRRMNRNISENRPWMDTGKSAEERADLLLAEMTLKEKAGQLNLYALYRSDPWSERNYENGLCGEMAVR